MAAVDLFRRHNLVDQRPTQFVGKRVQRSGGGQAVCVVRRHRVPGIVGHTLIMPGRVTRKYLFGPAIGRYVPAGVQQQFLAAVSVAKTEDQDMAGAPLLRRRPR
jgi:hypothetical protein